MEELKKLEGKTISYLKLCQAVGHKNKRNTQDRIEHIEHFRNFIDFEFIGKKLKIINITGEPIPFDKRMEKSKILNVSNYTHAELNKSGVYLIKSLVNNDAYIGSTTLSFKTRYRSHMKPSNKTTSKQIVENDHEVEILYVNEKYDEPMLRRIEECYIQYYSMYTDYNVVNKRDGSVSHTRKNFGKKKERWKTIRVNGNEYEKTIKLLQDNGIKIKPWGDGNESY